jgi:carbamoyltransferase
VIVLGLHGGVTINQHEPGAALLIDGKIVAMCEEERYLRIKNAYGYLPFHSIKACLEIANLRFDDIQLVVAPGITYDHFGDRIRHHLNHHFGSCPPIELVHHQQAHLAAAFYGSGLEESMVLSLDASGDGLCGMYGYATKKDGITVIEKITNRQSIGYFYTLMTFYLGFSDGDEYKLMGLAPFGEPTIDLSAIIKPCQGGWDFTWDFIRSDPPSKSPFEPIYSLKLQDVLGQPPRQPEAPLTSFHKDLARSTQVAFEACLSNLTSEMGRRMPGLRHLCYGGGVALNCAANRQLLYSGNFDHVYISPVSSDRGIALGCAYLGAADSGDTPWPLIDPYQGSSYSDQTLRNELISNGISFTEVEDPAEVGARLIAEDKIIGWYQGRSEAGARALGNRSILAGARDEKMRDMVNARIKYREEFRPFAPSVLGEESESWFRTEGKELPFMCVAVDVRADKAKHIGAVVHRDGTSRVQTVRSSNNELYYTLIQRYAKETGVPVILNTSFNLKSQPIVETPRDAIMTFYGCGLDAMIMGNFLVRK